MASGTLAGAPWFTGLDNNGNPVAAGLLFTYTAGTTTKQATYSDVGLTTPNANPIILDAGGRATIFLSPGSSYKFVLSPSTDTDPPTNPIRTQDNVGAIPSSSANLDISGAAGEAIAAGQVAYLSDGSGGKTAGLWYLADADFTYASTLPEIGMAVAAIASLATGTIRLGGQVTGLTGLTTGTTYYISATAGALTATAPANPRFLGVADSTSSLILTPNPPKAPAPATSTITTTGTQTALALPIGTGDLVLFANNATILTLQGIAAGIDGQLLSIFSIGAGQVDLVHQGGSASAANRLVNFATSGNTPLAAGVGTAVLRYDGTATRWRLMSHAQGAYITPTFAAGNYTASSGTWTVGSGDVTTNRFLLKDRQLHVELVLVTTDTSATPAELRFVIPGGYTAAAQTRGFATFSDAGASRVLGVVASSGAGATYLTVEYTAGTAFAASSGATTVFANVLLDVQ